MNELSIKESKMLRGIAILSMVCLHLYNRVNTEGFYSSYICIGGQPLIYYVSFIFDICVPIYCFLTGYGMYIKNPTGIKTNVMRIFKLLVRFWVILLFTCIAGMAFKNPNVPGSAIDFLGNASLIKLSYVGAWWFLPIYVIMILLSPIIIKVVKKVKWFISIPLSLAFYLVSYYFREMNPLKIGISAIDFAIRMIVLFGTSQFTFILGMYFYKHGVISHLRNRFGQSNVIPFVLFIAVILSRVAVRSMIAAPFTATAIILIFSITKIHKPFEKILTFFGYHSTNIWLTHMQFYMVFQQLKRLVFITDTVLGCFIILILMCLIVSYIVDGICKLILKPLEKSKV